MMNRLERDWRVQSWDTWIVLHQKNVFFWAKIILSVVVSVVSISVMLVDFESGLVMALVGIAFLIVTFVVLDRFVAVLVTKVVRSSARKSVLSIEKYNDKFQFSLVDTVNGREHEDHLNGDIEFLGVFDVTYLRGRYISMQIGEKTISLDFEKAPKELVDFLIKKNAASKNYKFSSLVEQVK